MNPTRRHFLQSAVAVTVGFRGLHTLLASPARAGDRADAGFGPLIKDAEGLLDLPAGFRYRIIARRGSPMSDGLIVPGQPDAMGAFAGPDGRVLLVCNHELDPDMLEFSPFGRDNALLSRVPAEFAFDRGRGVEPCIGGTTTLVYDPGSGTVERHYLSLACTKYNCAGGVTPWGTWISCEETASRAGKKYEQDHGYPFEVTPSAEIQLTKPTPYKAMGRFRREAVAVHPPTGIVYQTEDVDDSAFYRFIPAQPGKLAAGGRVQALRVLDQPGLDTRNWTDEETGKPLAAAVPLGRSLRVGWVDLDNVEAPDDDLRLRAVRAGGACFARTEGIWRGSDAFYFACTSGGRERLGQIWKYTPSPAEGTPAEAQQPGALELFAEPNDASLIQNCDNLTVAPWGDLIVCEDNGDVNYIDGVTPDGRLYKLARNARDKSEFAGSVFSPDGSTLFVNLQLSGLTLAITGPWGRVTAVR